ncbi:Phosducin family protein [Choiromyces venosus 120613-1]|uniref:Phosducin family protein n=1 Tax=Choiromyces venosus 120613-1 TaxID=1336337 RepID=A0A3N4J610_9PEZI|nr:Phosducin family protein [Choiromyces venosus 120613-1]
MDMPVNVPIDDPNADTEWNDILRKHGVIPEKPPSPTPMIEEAILQARVLARENRLEGKDLDELDELEDEEDEEFLAIYKQKRLDELSTLSQKSVHGHVYHLQKPDYSRDVTDASKEYTVLVNMTGSNAESRLLSALWRQAAEKFADVKFCEIAAGMCIEGYPDANCPTILVYKNEDIVDQVIRLGRLRGVDTRLEDIEKLLVQVDAIKSTDQRLRRTDEDDEDGDRSRIKTGNSSKAKVEDDDEDWD